MQKVELFDYGKMVGAKLLQLLNERGITRTEICNMTNVSKPTFNKLLNGELTNKVNFYKHLEKVLEYLNIDYDEFIYTIRTNRLKDVIDYKNMTVEGISDITGIDKERIIAILEGKEAQLSDYRDIAFILGTSVKTIQGKEQIELQVAEMSLFHTKKTQGDDEIGAFWKTLGVLLNERDDYIWFPVTDLILDNLNTASTQQWFVLPCMGNRVLLVNRNQVKEMVFVDEADEGPEGYDWEEVEKVAFTPLVIYETLEEYCMEDFSDVSSNEVSDNFKKLMDRYWEDNDWNEDDVFRLTDSSKIYFADGSEREVYIDLLASESILEAVEQLYYWRFDELDKLIMYYDFDGSIHVLNADNIAMIELPFVKLENALEHYRNKE